MRQSLRTHPPAPLQAASGIRSVLDDFLDSRFSVGAAIVFHRVGLLGRTMGFKKEILYSENLFWPPLSYPVVLPHNPGDSVG